MSVVRCGNCHRDYWRYWRYPGAPVTRYCSQLCFDTRRRKQFQPSRLSPEAPLEVIEQLREHLLEVHRTADLIAWFPRCNRCEVLQERLAGALSEASGQSANVNV
jgi:hypothetical protein